MESVNQDDSMEIIGQGPHPSVVIHDSGDELLSVHFDGCALVTIHKDGTATFDPAYTPDIATKAFWDALAAAGLMYAKVPAP